MMKKNSIVRLAGKRIHLCILQTDDESMQLYTMWNNDPTINMWIGHNCYVDSYTTVQKLYRQNQTPASELFGIVKIPEQILIGVAEIRFSNRNRNAELTVYIGNKSFLRCGCGTEATQLLIRYAFDEVNAHRVALSITGDNFASISCAEKNGFVRCGEEHDATFYNGHYCSIIHMEMLKSSWLRQNDG